MGAVALALVFAGWWSKRLRPMAVGFSAFAALSCDHDPLSLDLDQLADLTGEDSDVPRGVIALPALQRWLLEHPRAYTRMELRHIVRGHNVSERAVASAIELSETKYCSVAATLRPGVEIVTSYEIVEETE